MKRISEVTKLTGLSRKALQEYDRMGLLKHTTTTEGGYWLYDDAAIDKLYFILMFVEVGYTRSKIKDMLDNPELNVVQELDSAICLLEEKKKRTESLIKLARIWKSQSNMSDNMYEVVSRVGMTEILNSKNYSDEIEKALKIMEKFSEDDMHTAERVLLLMQKIYSIIWLRKSDPNSRLVQNCVNELYLEFIKIVEDDEGEKIPEEEIYCEEAVEVFISYLNEILISDTEWISEIKETYGDYSISFLNKALEEFMLLVKNGYWK